MGTAEIRQPPDEQPADLAWLAFRYVCAELSADETAAFELRLFEDQSAREAVAQAIELSAAVKQAMVEEVATPEPAMVCLAEARGFWSQKSWLQPAGWMVIGAAACLAAVICFYQPAGDDQASVPHPQVGDTVEQPARSLAMVWAESRHPGVDVAEFDQLFMGDSRSENSNFEHGDDDHGSEIAEDAHVIAPGWLLAAVTRGEMTDDLHLFSDDE